MQPYLRSLYKALITTAYFGLFRVGELTATFSNHAVRAKDVHLGANKKKMLFVLHTSKTHGKESKPQKIKISSRAVGSESNLGLNGEVFCPYQLLHQYLACRGGYAMVNEQFFVFSDLSPVAANHFCHTLSLMLKIAGYDYGNYGTHSLHARRSLDLLKYRLSVENIKQLGRWRSNTVFKYLKN